jgi:uncharacterized protein involved in exopolysaccharide biosynthesis
MTALGEELNKARLELRAAEQSRDALKRELTGEDPVFLPEGGGAPTGVVPEIDARIDALKKNLDELLRRYTEQHPDVIGTKRIIEQLEEERRKEIGSRQKAGGSKSGVTSMDRNPVYQQLRIALAESEAKVAALRARVGSFEAEYDAAWSRAVVAADRGRVHAAEPRLRDRKEELRGPRGAARARFAVERNASGGHLRDPRDRSTPCVA